MITQDTERHAEFAEWYRRLWPTALRAVTVAVGDANLAEEATAEAFARAFARWPQAATLDSPPAWLYRVATNEVRSRWRRARLERRVLAQLGAQQLRHHIEPAPREEAVWRAVAALPARTRQMVALRYVLDLTEAQIAADLGVSRGHVAATLSKARRDLGTALVDRFGTPELSVQEMS